MPYIVYCLRNAMMDTYECQFWLGRELIERIELTRTTLDQHVRESEEYMNFFWDLFLLARGEKEVLEYQEKNSKYPARFLITRYENEEKIRLRGLSMENILQESRR